MIKPKESAKKFEDMTPLERLAYMNEHGVTLFQNMSDEDKRRLLHMPGGVS